MLIQSEIYLIGQMTKVLHFIPKTCMSDPILVLLQCLHMHTGVLLTKRGSLFKQASTNSLKGLL